MKYITLDFDSMIESVRKDDRIHNYKIDELQVYESFLYYKRRYVEHKYHEYVEYNLFPNENIGVYKLYQYNNASFDPSAIYRYYVDMVSVAKNGNTWKAKDLYIDFIVKGDGKYYVVDIDEFNDAILRKELDELDIKNALNGLDNILNGYYVNYDMDKYVSSLREFYIRKDKLILHRGAD
ncbi:MAG: DUF402 domain-containing protein [Caulobacteraceae bacterium]